MKPSYKLLIIAVSILIISTISPVMLIRHVLTQDPWERSREVLAAHKQYSPSYIINVSPVIQQL